LQQLTSAYRKRTRVEDGGASRYDKHDPLGRNWQLPTTESEQGGVDREVQETEVAWEINPSLELQITKGWQPGDLPR
jgi:hypothetical protein